MSGAYLALSLALGAGNLLLGDHTRTDHLGFHDGSSALAVFAGLDSFSTFSVAVVTENGLLVVEGDHLAGIDVFQRDVDLFLGGLDLSTLLFGLTAAMASKHAEDVFETAHAATAVLDAFQTVLVVELSLLGVTEDLVGSVDFLKLSLLTSLVRMVLEGFLSEGLLDFGLSCLLGYAQNIVELLGIDVLFFFLHCLTYSYFRRLGIRLGNHRQRILQILHHHRHHRKDD